MSGEAHRDALDKLDASLGPVDEALAHKDEDDFMDKAKEALPGMRAATEALTLLAEQIIEEDRQELAEERAARQRRDERPWWKFWSGS